MIFAAAHSVLSPKLAVLSLIPGSCSRPADVYLPLWKCGLSADLNVMVTTRFQCLTIQEAASTQGHALSVAENHKITIHGPECQSLGLSFIPLVIENLGGQSP